MKPCLVIYSNHLNHNVKACPFIKLQSLENCSLIRFPSSKIKCYAKPFNLEKQHQFIPMQHVLSTEYQVNSNSWK